MTSIKFVEVIWRTPLGDLGFDFEGHVQGHFELKYRFFQTGTIVFDLGDYSEVRAVVKYIGQQLCDSQDYG